MGHPPTLISIAAAGGIFVLFGAKPALDRMIERASSRQSAAKRPRAPTCRALPPAALQDWLTAGTAISSLRILR